MKSSSLRSTSLLLAGLVLAPLAAKAVPSFARQMDMQCIACHTEFPLLNNFGRLFKLNGYTLSVGQSELPPIAVMLQPSFTNTQQGQAGGAAPGFKDNNNPALTQASVFYAGRLFGPYAASLFGTDGAAIANKFGVFIQTTYNGIGKQWHWDNSELRFANTGEVAGVPVTYGAYANNNPMMQDPWNSTPAWGFPFSGSGLAPTPAASPLLQGALAQQVGGVGAYALVAESFYFDVAGYQTLNPQFQTSVGIDPNGETQLDGVAPYWRAAYTKTVGNSSFEAGTFGLVANTFPGRDSSAGQDRIADIGFDAQAQTSFDQHDFTAMLTWINERENWNASQTLTNTSNAVDNLHSLKATVDYLFDKTYGAAVQAFAVDGSTDQQLYGASGNGDSANNSPRSNGVILQLNYLPFNKAGGPAVWPRSNVKLSLQYTIYRCFDGASRNYDGQGHNASDNNTLYLEAWIAF
jgi:hypothetical protein